MKDTKLAPANGSSYTLGTVWQLSNIRVEPGQLDRYLDYLAGDWKKEMEFAKEDGWVISYHVLSVNNARHSEPNLVLAIEYKNYVGNEERMAQNKKIEALFGSDLRTMQMASGEREAQRKLLGSMQLQELKLS